MRLLVQGPGLVGWFGANRGDECPAADEVGGVGRVVMRAADFGEQRVGNGGAERGGIAIGLLRRRGARRLVLLSLPHGALPRER